MPDRGSRLFFVSWIHRKIAGLARNPTMDLSEMNVEPSAGGATRRPFWTRGTLRPCVFYASLGQIWSKPATVGRARCWYHKTVLPSGLFFVEFSHGGKKTFSTKTSVRFHHNCRFMHSCSCCDSSALLCLLQQQGPSHTPVIN